MHNVNVSLNIGDWRLSVRFGWGDDGQDFVNVTFIERHDLADEEDE